jgi:hypothetical protein
LIFGQYEEDGAMLEKFLQVFELGNQVKFQIKMTSLSTKAQDGPDLWEEDAR